MEQLNKTFVAVLRGNSSAVFKQNEFLKLNVETPEYGIVEVTYATRWIKKTKEITLPGQIWIEIRGKGDELDKVLNVYANVGLFALSILSVAANAAVAQVDLELGYETTENIKERDYFQRFLPNENSDLFSFNRINVKDTLRFMDLINTNIEKERILRAASQYRLALDWWGLGGESMCVAHLWMAIEALTKAFLRRELIKNNLNTNEELANKLNIETKQLDSYIRKNIILKGDINCYKKALEASDGFEHGFLNYDVIRNKAKDIRPTLAKYVRDAILELTDLPEDVFVGLTTEPFDKPCACGPLVRYLRGKLIGENKNLAKEGNAYPFVHWTAGINSFKENVHGRFDVEFNDKMTLEVAKDISFKPVSFEVWKID